jgi:hypothetical protein
MLTQSALVRVRVRVRACARALVRRAQRQEVQKTHNAIERAVAREQRYKVYGVDETTSTKLRKATEAVTEPQHINIYISHPTHH